MCSKLYEQVSVSLSHGTRYTLDMWQMLLHRRASNKHRHHRDLYRDLEVCAKYSGQKINITFIVK